MHMGVPVVALGAILISSCGGSDVAPGAPPPGDSDPVAALHPTPDVAFITISDVTADLVVSPEVPFPLLFDLPYGSHVAAVVAPFERIEDPLPPPLLAASEMSPSNLVGWGSIPPADAK